MEKLDKQHCPFCKTNNLTLMEDEKDIPYFGKVFIFSMDCKNCKYHKGDIETAEQREPCKITFTTESEKDLQVRVVKSSYATVKVPQMRMSVTPGPSSNGYVSNIEGVLNKFKEILEDQRDNSDDDSVKKHAKNLLKKLRKAMYGDVALKIIIEDPSGNSAIIDKKAKIEKLKK